MLLTSAFQKLAFRIMSLIFAVFLSSNPVVPPSQAHPVERDGAKLVFAAVADTQISNYMPKRYPVFKAACEDLHNNAASIDALLVAGDLAENGLAAEYQTVYDGLAGLDARYIVCTGNHDLRLRSYKQSSKRINAFVNALNGDSAAAKLNYAETVNGVKFIVLGSNKTEFEEAYFTDETLNWLDGELAAANGEPVFVVCHQPLKLTHGLPDTWGSPINSAGSVGDQSDALKDIFTSYKNVVFVTGHLHTGLGEYTYETVGGTHLVNLPSLCINNKDGEYNQAGTGFIVKVLENEIIFSARDFAQGKWLPEYDIVIPVV